jgi:hypothetical protein
MFGIERHRKKGGKRGLLSDYDGGHYHGETRREAGTMEVRDTL